MVETDIFKFITDILTSHNRLELSLGVFSDLFKTCITMNHEYSLTKFNLYGFRDLKHIASWESQATGRKGGLSPNRLKFLQGSLLGPSSSIISLNYFCDILKIVDKKSTNNRNNLEMETLNAFIVRVEWYEISKVIK